MTTPPPNIRPYANPLDTGKEWHTTTADSKQYWRQIGWLGGSGAFYALNERPGDHEPGSWGPLWSLLENDRIEEPEVPSVDQTVHMALDTGALLHYTALDGRSQEQLLIDAGLFAARMHHRHAQFVSLEATPAGEN